MLSNPDPSPETPSQEDGTAHLFSALGKQIKALREYRGMTQVELATAVRFGPDLISAIERHTRTPQPEFLRAVDPVLRAHGTLIAAIPDVEEALKKNRTRHPDWYRNYAKLEAEALELHDYSNQAILGLLQTEDYAQAIFQRRRPLLSEETINKRVADRISRQAVFEKWPPTEFSFIIEEDVLRRPIGGRDIHHAQLRSLLKVSEMRNVHLQAASTAWEEHPNMDGAFTLIVAKNGQHVGYTEVQGHARLITDPEEVRDLEVRYAIMRSQCLRPPETVDLIMSILGDR
ncbi:helix-turn-helix domain-containing protein [Streptomyces sp. NPDC087440]|uniref:helix-turn-helix domain-containing protein n=1 Tax=Streptomyces sp. NPDC087440 TaxID=3365790 RepID=UPI003817090D